MTAHIGDPLLHTYQEAAQRLNVSVRWLQEHVQRRTIPHRRLGRQVRFSDDDLQEILDSTRQGRRPSETSDAGLRHENGGPIPRSGSRRHAASPRPTKRTECRD